MNDFLDDGLADMDMHDAMPDAAYGGMYDDMYGEAWDAGPETAAEAEEAVDERLGEIFDEKTSQADDQYYSDQPRHYDGEPVDPAIAAPHAWSADMSGQWARVPPEIQEYIADRETQAHAQITRMGQELAQARPIHELLDQNLDLFDAAGVSASEGLPLLLNAQRLLNENPVQGIAAIAESYGIDLGQMFGAPDGHTDPYMGQLQAQVTQLQNQLQQRENQELMALAREDEARLHEAHDHVLMWGQDKPYFEREDVRELMGLFIENGQAHDLETAYDAACHAIGDVRYDLAMHTQAAWDAHHSAVVRDAKRAARSNLGSKFTGVVAPGGAPDDDAYLGNLFDRVVNG